MNIKRVKNIAAFLLLICLVLPMSKCAKPLPPPPSGEVKVQNNEPIEYYYLIPLAEINIYDPLTYSILLAFIWPFPLWLIKYKCRLKWSIRIVNIAEFILISFSFYLIINFAFFFRQPCLGGYIAFASVSVLLILFLSQVVIDLI